MILNWRSVESVDAQLSSYGALIESGFIPDSCMPVPRPFPESDVAVGGAKEPPDFFNAGNVTIVSDRLRKIIERFETGAEFLKVSATLRGNIKADQQFFLMNILDCVECFDYEKSTYESSEVGVDEIDHLALVDSMASGHHLFNVGPFSVDDEDNPKAMNDNIIGASDELARVILESDVTGVAFVLPEHWRDYPVENVAWTPS